MSVCECACVCVHTKEVGLGGISEFRKIGHDSKNAAGSGFQRQLGSSNSFQYFDKIGNRQRYTFIMVQE